MFLFRQEMISYNLRFIFDHPLMQWEPMANRGKRKERQKYKKSEHLKKEEFSR